MPVGQYDGPLPLSDHGLYAKSVAVQEQPNADFVISFTPGNFYFTVRALRKEAADHLTVIYNRKAYVLQLAASEEPFYSLTFFRGGNTRAGTRPVVPERLLSLLDKAKASQLFQKDYPDALAGVVHAAPDATNYYDNFKVVTRDVWRFEEEDTLVFRVDLENTSDQTVYYKPQDLAVRLEDRIYTQSVADASGVMPRIIIPAGTEVHGVAQKSPVRERIGSGWQWFLVFQDGRELPVSGTVLDYAPDPKDPNSWAESDGSAGLRGFIVKSDKYAEAKAILAAMISAGAGAFPESTTLISPLGGATQLNNGGIESAFSAGLQAGGQIYSKRLLEQLNKDPFYVRVPAGTTFYLYLAQTVDLAEAVTGLSASIPAPNNPPQP